MKIYKIDDQPNTRGLGHLRPFNTPLGPPRKGKGGAKKNREIFWTRDLTLEVIEWRKTGITWPHICMRLGLSESGVKSGYYRACEKYNLMRAEEHAKA